MDTEEFLQNLNKGIGVGFVQGAKKRPKDDEIAQEAYRLFGDGDILASALKQLGPEHPRHCSSFVAKKNEGVL